MSDSIRYGACTYSRTFRQWRCGPHGLLVKHDPEDGTRLNDDGTTTPVAPATSLKRGLVGLEWLANRLCDQFDRYTYCGDCPLQREGHCVGIGDNKRLPASQIRVFCVSHILAAALSVTGQDGLDMVPRKALDAACTRILKLTEWRGCPEGKAADCDNARHRTDKLKCIKCMGDAVLDAIAKASGGAPI